MSRRRDRSSDLAGPVISMIGLVILGVSFSPQFRALALIGLMCFVGLAVVIGFGALCFFLVKQSSKSPPVLPVVARRRLGFLRDPASVPLVVQGYSRPAPAPAPPPRPHWTISTVKDALGLIDWFQFEKFCSALLRAEGYQVERKGGAKPDGGVDLISARHGVRTLVQCKHWRSWSLKEGVVREMLGSMTDFQVADGAIYTLKGWTQPAAEFAAKHGIILVNGDELARRAVDVMTDADLDEVLDSSSHHCPRCESVMVWRDTAADPFWGCSRFPRCRYILKERGPV